MNIEVLFFGKFRELAGASKEEAGLQKGDKLSNLLAKLEEKHGNSFAREIKDNKGLRILVNGREYQILDGLDTPLKEKDTVVILPLIEGG